MRRFLLCVAAAGVLAFGVVVPGMAADDAKAEAAFKKMDKNSDGKVSEEEFVGKRTGEKADKAKSQFKKLDKDSDGSLSLEEFKAAKKKAK